MLRWSLGIILFSMLSGTLPFECAAASRCKRYAAVLEQGIQVRMTRGVSRFREAAEPSARPPLSAGRR